MSVNPRLMRGLQRLFAGEATAHPILLVYLFGSQAMGMEGPRSDYDFAVLFEGEVPSEERYALMHRLAEHLGTDRVDLVVLNSAPIELRYNVVATGHLLYETDPTTRVEFEARTLSRYFDHLPELRRQRRELLEEGEGDYAVGIQRYRAALGATERLLAQIRATEGEGKG